MNWTISIVLLVTLTGAAMPARAQQGTAVSPPGLPAAPELSNAPPDPAPDAGGRARPRLIVDSAKLGRYAARPQGQAAPLRYSPRPRMTAKRWVVMSAFVAGVVVLVWKVRFDACEKCTEGLRR